MGLKVHSPSAAGRDILHALGALERLTEADRADVRIVDADDMSAGDAAIEIRLGSGGFEEMLDDCLRIGAAIGMDDAARHLTVGLRNRMFEAAECVNPFEDGPNVAFFTTINPPRFAGGWIVQLIERAGGRCPWNPTVARQGTGSASGPQQGEREAGPGFEMRGSEFVEYPADVLVLCADGLDATSCLEQARALMSSPRFSSQPALRSRRVACVDGRGTFSVRGPGLVDCFEWLVSWLNGRPSIGRGVTWVGI
ncbi:MAG: ABC transporter substrate-binding protein [Phycisphaerales bacterium]